MSTVYLFLKDTGVKSIKLDWSLLEGEFIIFWEPKPNISFSDECSTDGR